MLRVAMVSAGQKMILLILEILLPTIFEEVCRREASQRTMDVCC